MEALLANTDQLKGKMKEKVEANKELGLLSKELAKILLDVPVTFQAEAYELSDPDFPAVEEIFDDLEFRRMKENIQKIFGQEVAAASPQSTSASPKKTATLDTGQMDLFSAGGGNTDQAAISSKKT